MTGYTATYSINDMVSIGVDVGAKFMAALAEQAGNLGSLVVVILVLGLILDYFTGIIGIFARFRKTK